MLRATRSIFFLFIFVFIACRFLPVQPPPPLCKSSLGSRVYTNPYSDSPLFPRLPSFLRLKAPPLTLHFDFACFQISSAVIDSRARNSDNEPVSSALKLPPVLFTIKLSTFINEDIILKGRIRTLSLSTSRRASDWIVRRAISIQLEILSLSLSLPLCLCLFHRHRFFVIRPRRTSLHRSREILYPSEYLPATLEIHTHRDPRCSGAINRRAAPPRAFCLSASFSSSASTPLLSLSLFLSRGT